MSDEMYRHPRDENGNFIQRILETTASPEVNKVQEANRMREEIDRLSARVRRLEKSLQTIVENQNNLDRAQQGLEIMLEGKVDRRGGS